MNAAGALRQLRCDLEKLGLQAGSAVLLHASLRRVRPEEGGAATVVRAVRDVLGRHGTLVVPAQTAWNSTTSPHFLAATAGMTAEQITRYLATLPAFDPLVTPSAGMGAVAEYVRTRPDAVRSAHPQTSFAAVGSLARELMADHDLDCLLGGRSPLAALYRHDGRVLHLGTGYEVATIFHLGEWRATARRRRYSCRYSAAPSPSGWVSFEDVDYRDDDFAALGAQFERRTCAVSRGPFGAADALLYPARAAADHAAEWTRRERRETERVFPERTTPSQELAAFL